MGLTLRPSHPSLIAVGRALTLARNDIVHAWSRWVLDRIAELPTIPAAAVERQLGILVDALIEMAGPLRRDAVQLWLSACEAYGRTSSARGLAAGEVVEEIQHLRELLIRHLSEPIVALPARAAIATVLRLNRLVDKGIAHAVVGYTDALVETLFEQRGVPVAEPRTVENEVDRRLTHLEAELQKLREQTL